MGDLADRDRRPEQRGPRLSDPSASAGFFCRHPLLVLRTVAPFPPRKAGVPALTSLLPPLQGTSSSFYFLTVSGTAMSDE